MRPLPLVLLCCFFASPPVLADAYKCRRPDGKVEISSTPCAQGSKTESSKVADPVSPEQRAAAQEQLKREREYVKDREAARAAEAAREPPPPPPPQPQPAAAPQIVPVPVYVPSYGPGYPTGSRPPDTRPHPQPQPQPLRPFTELPAQPSASTPPCVGSRCR